MQRGPLKERQRPHPTCSACCVLHQRCATCSAWPRTHLLSRRLPLHGVDLPGVHGQRAAAGRGAGRGGGAAGGAHVDKRQAAFVVAKQSGAAGKERQERSVGEREGEGVDERASPRREEYAARQGAEQGGGGGGGQGQGAALTARRR